MLLNLLSVRVIVNGTHIYALSREHPAVIVLPKNHSRIVVSDGYHFTKPVEVGFHHMHTHHFRVACAIDDNILAAGALLLVLFYMVGLISDIFILKVLSFLPILYFLYLYYINRKEFIKIKPVADNR
ncbi:MAG TPA: hypothetical protein VGB46_07095 [Flavisolibacter sp.]|jgi:hypothetical protein